MGDKYIIELEDKPFHKEDGDFLYRVKGFNSLVFDMTGISKLAPYHEPDLGLLAKENFERGYRQRKAEDEKDIEQVKKEAYENGYENGFVDGHLKAEKSGQKFYEDGYKRGLDDAWEAVRKICCSVTAGGLNYNTLDAVFGSRYPEHIVATFTASEVIERFKQFEQKQEESKKEQSVTDEESMRKYLDEFCNNTKSCTVCPLHTSDFTCGRGYHFMTENPVSDEEVRRAYAKVVKER